MIDEKTKIIFLDMDGVLNSENFIRAWEEQHKDDRDFKKFKDLYFFHEGYEGFVVPELVGRLKKICEKTGAKIIWSSSWRILYRKEDTAKIWKAKGLPVEFYLGSTPDLYTKRYSYVPRGLEIRQWIKENEKRFNIEKMVVLDDDYDAGCGLQQDDRILFINTCELEGLTEEDAARAVEWLNGK